MRPHAAIIALVFVFAPPNPTTAQVSHWQLGGQMGLQWAASDTNRIFIDFTTAPGAIQPIYLTPDRTVYSHLDNWSALRLPRELGFVDGERPRAWRDSQGGEAPDRNGTYLVDGDSLTFTPPLSDPRVQIYFTLDTAVPVPATRFGFYTPPRGFRSDGKPYAEDAVPAYEISIAPDVDPVIYSGGYNRVGQVIAQVAENLESTVHIDFPRQYVRFVRYQRKLSSIDNPVLFAVNSQAGTAQRGTIGDFELFGEGVPQRVLYTTRIIDLDTELNFGRLFWSATALKMVDGQAISDEQGLSGVRVEVRVGRDDDPNIYQEFDDKGREVEIDRDRFEYDLKESIGFGYVASGRPGVRASVKYDSDNWTFWSPAFRESGQSLLLQSGSHMQLKISLDSGDFDHFARLDSLWIETAPLLARQVFGEIARGDDLHPRRGFAEAPLGEEIEFTYAVRPVFANGDERGFDSMRIRTGSRPTWRGLTLDGEAADPTAVEVTDDELVVHLPRRVHPGDAASVELSFTSELFDFAHTFSGEVFERDTASLPQLVQAGDASQALGTSSLRVFGATKGSVAHIQDVALSSKILTPNGDRINDILQVDYTLFRLPEPIPVSLKVYALDGRRVANLPPQVQPSGRQTLLWDGRDDSGRLLTPGIYLLEVSLASEANRTKNLLPINIAY